MQTAAIAAPLIKNNAKRNAIFDVSPVATDSPITGLTDAVNLSCEKSWYSYQRHILKYDCRLPLLL